MELVGDRTVRRCVASCQSVFEILSGGRLSRPMTFVHLLVRGYRLVDQVAVEKMCSSLKLLAFQFAEVWPLLGRGLFASAGRRASNGV